MNQGEILLWGGLICGLFMTMAVYRLGSYLEVSANLPVRVLFSIGIGALACPAYLFASIAGKRYNKD